MMGKTCLWSEGSSQLSKTNDCLKHATSFPGKAKENEGADKCPEEEDFAAAPSTDGIFQSVYRNRGADTSRARLVDPRMTKSGSTAISGANSMPSSIRLNNVRAANSPILRNGCRTVVRLGV